MYFTLQGSQTIVALLLIGYSFVTQLFPAVMMSLTRNNKPTPAGAFAGITVGLAAVVATSLTHSNMASLFPALPEALRDLNVGIVALVLNIVAALVVSAAERATVAPRRA